jgi:hypothetical protein
MAAHQVRALLMGGQACVFYGAAEFSRDTDLLILLEPGNLDRLSTALNVLQAELIAVPPFKAEPEQDRQYWLPLRAELERLRHGLKSQPRSGNA